MGDSTVGWKGLPKRRPLWVPSKRSRLGSLTVKAPFSLSLLIHRSAWKTHSPKFVVAISEPPRSRLTATLYAPNRLKE
jgi:hypothetical protein